MVNNFESSFEPRNQAPDQQDVPESLKNHDRVVSTKEEMNQLITEYQSKGWEIDSQDENHAKLTKSFNCVMDSTPRMRGATVTLEVNINVAE